MIKERLIFLLFCLPFLFAITLTVKAESGNDADRYDAEYEMKKFKLDPEEVEFACVREKFLENGKDIDSRTLIAGFKSGEIQVFDYASKQLISETLPNGDIKDHIAHELLKATSVEGIYEVYQGNKFCYKIEFLEDRGLKIFGKNGKLIQRVDRNHNKRYLNNIYTGFKIKTGLFYQFAVKENK